MSKYFDDLLLKLLLFKLLHIRNINHCLFYGTGMLLSLLPERTHSLTS